MNSAEPALVRRHVYDYAYVGYRAILSICPCKGKGLIDTDFEFAVSCLLHCLAYDRFGHFTLYCCAAALGFYHRIFAWI